MAQYEGLLKKHQPDYQGLIDNILRKGTPRRVYHMELFHDQEIRTAIAARFDLMKGVGRDCPDYNLKEIIAVNRFIGWDYVCASLDVGLQFHNVTTDDTAELARDKGRTFRDEHVGPVTNWEQFEKYPWPNINTPSATKTLEFLQENLPDDMCICGFTGHFAEELSWLPGYETLCYMLFEQPDLVHAIADKLMEYYHQTVVKMLQFDKVKLMWATDDMGFKTGLLISPGDTRKYVLPGHSMLADMSHQAGIPYLLHSCGMLDDIMPDLINDVKIDAKHSFEDTIEDVRDAKRKYGKQIALIGGLDIDFLCRSDEQAIRQRVRQTLDACMPGGGYCLGTGNSVANYIPLENYLAMVDEGRLYA